MNDQPHHPDELKETPVDAGSQALSEALRSSFAIVKFLMAALVLVFLASGFFTVKPQERAMVLHFGKPVGEGEKALLGPGPHWSYPYPIDEVVKVSISGIQSVTSTVGWYATTPEQELAGTEPPAGGSLNPAVDGYLLTADGNIIHSRATLRYRISDPIGYIFNFTHAETNIQSALDNAMLATASRFNVDDILTRDVIGFREAVRRRVTELVEKQKIGIVVDQLSVRSIPPRQLKDAFANVLKAEVKRNQTLEEAHSYENQVTNKAGADAQSRINLAQSDRARLVNEVASRAEQFQELLPKYLQNPGLFIQQRLTETLGRVFTNAQEKILWTDSRDGNTRDLRLLLSREPPSLKPEEPKQP